MLFRSVQFISKESLIEENPEFAEKILEIIAYRFDNISERDQNTIKKHLAGKKCIPTKIGMRTPDQSYFPNVDLFPDLPIIHCQSNIVNPFFDFFSFLGVRKVNFLSYSSN